MQVPILCPDADGMEPAWTQSGQEHARRGTTKKRTLYRSRQAPAWDIDVIVPNLNSMSPDFLGAFAVLEQDRRFLMVQNRRTIAGCESLTWDLPGGRVEKGELLGEALLRELEEETGLRSNAEPQFLFYQEGEGLVGERRSYAWRSFFFGLERWQGEAVAGSEVLALRWMNRSELHAELHAPYHDSFLLWLEQGGTSFSSCWRD